MGELLRAVCDATCIDSAPAFYTARLAYVRAVNQPANIFAERSTFLECKRDTWFLMMGWAQSTVNDPALGSTGLWGNRSKATSFTIRDAKTGRRYCADSTVQKVLQNFNLNSFVTLPEYVLWEPGALIEVIQNVQVATTLAFTSVVTDLVTLAGIEYKLPDRPGGYLSGRKAA